MDKKIQNGCKKKIGFERERVCLQIRTYEPHAIDTTFGSNFEIIIIQYGIQFKVFLIFMDGIL